MRRAAHSAAPPTLRSRAFSRRSSASMRSPAESVRDGRCVRRQRPLQTCPPLIARPVAVTRFGASALRTLLGSLAVWARPGAVWRLPAHCCVVSVSGLHRVLPLVRDVQRSAEFHNRVRGVPTTRAIPDDGKAVETALPAPSGAGSLEVGQQPGGDGTLFDEMPTAVDHGSFAVALDEDDRVRRLCEAAVAYREPVASALGEPLTLVRDPRSRPASPCVRGEGGR